MTRLRHPIRLLAAAALFALAPAGAWACTNPPGVEGLMIYNETSKVVQYCDGANWISMGGGSGGSSSLGGLDDVDITTLGNGDVLIYNTTTSKWEAGPLTIPPGVAGTDTQVQFNDGGTALAGAAQMLWNKTDNRLTLGTTTPGTTTLDVTGKTSTSSLILKSVSGGTPPTSGGTAGGGAGEVQFNTGGQLSGDGNFVWDNANKRLGIGVAAPVTSQMHIRGASAGIFLEETTGGADNDALIVHFSNKLQIQNRTSAGVYTRLPYQFDMRAPDNSINVLDNGRVGLGAAPLAKLHIAEPAASIRLQDTGNTTASNVLAGIITFRDSAGTEYGWVGDGSSSNNFMTMHSGLQGARLSSPGGMVTLDPDGYFRMRSDSVSGSWSVGTGRVYVAGGSGNTNGYIWSTIESGNTQYNMYLHRHSASGGYVHFGYGSSTVGSITTNGTTTTYGTSSDYRLKENIGPVTSGLESVMRLKPVHYNFKADPSQPNDGFLAHEVQEIAPYAVSGKKDGVGADGKPAYQVLDYGKLTPLLTAAIQEQQAQIDALKAQNEALMRRLDALEGKQ